MRVIVGGAWNVVGTHLQARANDRGRSLFETPNAGFELHSFVSCAT